VKAANFGIPGILGRLRRVNKSAIETNSKVKTVPNHPQLFLIQTPSVKIRVVTPKMVV
jgi:hypothetical protein